MPDDPTREKPPADENAEPTPKSPEEMMGALLQPAPKDDEPAPPEDYDSHLGESADKRPARPEDLPVDEPKPEALEPRERGRQRSRPAFHRHAQSGGHPVRLAEQRRDQL